MTYIDDYSGIMLYKVIHDLCSYICSHLLNLMKVHLTALSIVVTQPYKYFDEAIFNCFEYCSNTAVYIF